MDPIVQFKDMQKKGWALFGPLEMLTASTAPRLIEFSRISSNERVLDVGCGTGVVAITAARTGARVTGVDFSPELLARARDNAALAQTEVDWQEGDIEHLPFKDGAFDVVVSQWGHIFAPRPEVAIGEMLRVLKAGGRIAFSTWPPELHMGRMFALIGKHMPPPPGVAPPPQWGDPSTVRQRLGNAVRDIVFDRDALRTPILSPQHQRAMFERTVGPLVKLVQMLESDPPKLAAFRREFDEITAQYFENNYLRQDYLLTRAVKV